jgi:hypothetical protein
MLTNEIIYLTLGVEIEGVERFKYTHAQYLSRLWPNSQSEQVPHIPFCHVDTLPRGLNSIG